MPLSPSVAGSFSTACSRRKLTASRRVASRNSTRGIIIVFSLLFILAVSVKYFCMPSHGLARPTIAADRWFPAFFHLPQLARSCFVIRFFAVLVLGVIDFFLTLPRRSVVRIQGKHLIVPFHCEIVPAGIVKAVGLCEQLFHLLDLFDEGRTHRFVEITGLPQVRVEFLRRTTLGIVAVAQNFAQDRLGICISSLCDARLRQHDAALAKAFDSFVVRFSRHDCVGQIRNRSSEFFVRSAIVFCFHRSLTPRQGRFSLRYAGLTPVHFALGDVVRGLRKAACANSREADPNETKDNEGSEESNEWRGDLLRATP